MVIPKEHGTWLMFFLPFLLGVFLSQPNLIHIPLLIGWFLIYLASTPFLNIIGNHKLKKPTMPWLLSYCLLAVVFIVPVV